MLTNVPEYLSIPLRSPRNAVVATAALAAAGGLAWYLFRRPRPTEEEIERARRQLLASSGRITDGSITEAPLRGENSGGSQLIVYNYRIGGVTYEAAQDVTALGMMVQDIRTDLPVQVRYEPHNPANSIVVAESWSGLRQAAYHSHPEIETGPQHTD